MVDGTTVRRPSRFPSDSVPGTKRHHHPRGHPGHSHFSRRALSRRSFSQVTAATAGLILARPRSARADEEVEPDSPNPIPGGFTFGGEFFHNLAPGVFDPVDADPSGITDFNGHIGYAIVDGTGKGRT